MGGIPVGFARSAWWIPQDGSEGGSFPNKNFFVIFFICTFVFSDQLKIKIYQFKGFFFKFINQLYKIFI